MKKATRKHTKVHNRRLILRTIYKEQEISRAELARFTHLTKTTVSAIVTDLIAEGLIEETGRGPSEGGKPPVYLGIINDSRHLIGLDLANSEFRGCITDLYGKILVRFGLPLQNNNGQFALENVYKLTDTLLAQATSPLLGIGIGSPGLIDARSGIIHQAVNLDWQLLPLRDLLQSRYSLPVHLANDSHAAALGEYTFGPDRGSENLVVVKVGRGISAGIVLDGQLYYGDGSSAGEIGHVRIVDNGILCSCGHTGCLETVASSRAIIAKARLVFNLDPNSTLHNFAASVEDINTDTILEAFNAGDAAINQIVQEFGTYIGIAVANLIGVLNIHNIIIAGSLARFGQTLIDAVQKQIQVSAMSVMAAETKLTRSELGEDLVLLGAVSLLLSNELGVV